MRQIIFTGAFYYNWWFNSRAMPEAIRTLALKFSGMTAEFFNNWQVAEDYWRGDPSQNGGGVFADGGAHVVDMMLWLGGAPATEVAAFMDVTAPEIERYVSAQARLANGVLVTISESDIDGPGDDRVTIVGDKGVLTRDNTDIWLQTAAGREEFKVEGQDVYPIFPFVSCILDGMPCPIPAEAGAHAAALSEAAYRSAAEKRIVSISALS